jgi:hypothetical protein
VTLERVSRERTQGYPEKRGEAADHKEESIHSEIVLSTRSSGSQSGGPTWSQPGRADQRMLSRGAHARGRVGRSDRAPGRAALALGY